MSGLHGVLGIMALMLLSACTPKKGSGNYMNDLVAAMTGSFDSHAQSERDSDYFDISLHMYPIWDHLSDAKRRWFYVEQSLTSKPEAPYRQRIYRLDRTGEGEYISFVYTLPLPAEFIGKYKDPNAFDPLSPDELEVREGCAVYLSRTAEGTFKGGTRGENCESTINNAAYAVSEVEISANKIVSWDRGYNLKGGQVWGAKKGGYEFIRQ